MNIARWFVIPILTCAAFVSAQDQPVGKASLGIGAVRVNPAIVEAASRAGTKNEMDRVVQAMDGQLMDRLQNTRKFTLVSRSDLSDIMKEQSLTSSGNVDASDAQAAQAFKLAGCKYLLVTTIDNFQDYVEKATFEGYGDSATRRVVQTSAVAKIYDTTSGKLLESANLQLDNSGVERDPSYIKAHGDLKEDLFPAMARLLAQRVADRVVDVIYPAKVIARTDRSVTINRGDGTNIQQGQVWEAFALGQELKDPDTGASLGREEVKVGAVRITSVSPLVSKGEVIDDRGVDKGQVLRLVPPPGSMPPPGAGAPDSMSQPQPMR